MSRRAAGLVRDGRDSSGLHTRQETEPRAGDTDPGCRWPNLRAYEAVERSGPEPVQDTRSRSPSDNPVLRSTRTRRSRPRIPSMDFLSASSQQLPIPSRVRPLRLTVQLV